VDETAKRMIRQRVHDIIGIRVTTKQNGDPESKVTKQEGRWEEDSARNSSKVG